MRVICVTCDGNLRTTKNRSPHAYEHDLEFDSMRSAFTAHGDEIVEADWRVFEPACSSADLVFIRTVYDYTEHVEEFQTFLNMAGTSAVVANHPAVIRWNMDKHYLRDLADNGLPIIETLFLGEQARLGDVFCRLGVDEVVLKPVIGASGLGQARVRKGCCDSECVIGTDMFAQPFMESVTRSGEISMVFINGRYSHAVIKHCAPGEYRVHDSYGGTQQVYRPASTEVGLASSFVAVLPARCLACRVDFIRHGKGLLLMELEAVEPFLFPQFRADFGEHMHSACKAFLEEPQSFPWDQGPADR